MQDDDDVAAKLIEALGAGQPAVLICTNLPAGRTFRLGDPGAAHYLKVAPLTVPHTHDLTAETKRLRWIGDRLPYRDYDTVV